MRIQRMPFCDFIALESAGQRLRVSMYYDRRYTAVTMISVSVDGSHFTKPNNPITLIRMILVIIGTIEFRGIKRVQFQSFQEFNKIHEHFIRSFGWEFERVDVNSCPNPSSIYTCKKG